MDISNCPRCGKLFTRMSSPICEDCVKEEEELFQKVKQYIEENKDKNMMEVSEATGASMKKLMKYLREGRLELSTGMSSDKALKCAQCGKPITSGLYCDSCVIDINQSIDAIFNERKKEKGTGMHSIPDQNRR